MDDGTAARRGAGRTLTGPQVGESPAGVVPVVPPSSAPAPVGAPAAAIPGRQGVHLPALDGLRGLAILAVLLLHFAALTPEPTSDWPRLLWRTLKSGWIGVDLFFVLSGFLITGILVDAKGTPSFFRNFYMRRTLRIFPLYYAVLVLVFLVIPRFHMDPADAARLEQHGQWWYWLYLSNVLTAIEGSAAVPFDAGHLWSLALEEQFYLFWPLVVHACRRETLKRVCAGIIVGAFLVRLGYTLADDPNWYTYTEVKYVLLPMRADTLAFGGLLALLVREPGGVARLLPGARVGLVMAALPLAALFVWERGLNAIGATMQTLGFSALALFFGFLLVIAIGAPRGSLLHRVFTAGWLRMFGRYSYALYLFHHFIREPLWDAFAPFLVPADGEMSWLARWAFIAFGIAVSLVLAVLSWNVFEKHFLKLKDRFSYRVPERATVLPAP